MYSANTPGSAHPLPRRPRQGRDLCLWNVLALFEDYLRSDYMPLGFQFLPSPDQENRCDLADCPVSSNVPWKVFEACWHSYNLECVIENAISSFSLAANRSFNLLRNSSNDENIIEGEQG